MAPAEKPGTDVTLTRRPLEMNSLPSLTSPILPAPMATAAVRRSNRDLARDYLDLVFELETGRPVARLTRFRQPIRVRFETPAPPHLERALDALLVRLRTEAGLDIARAGKGERAAIHVNVIPRAMLGRVAPAAACFAVPNVADWRSFLLARGTPALDWARLERRERAAIFLPSDVAPQEARDCLQEELAQALGPVNDLFRLDDSIFNDDNLVSRLTSFDMLMLRVHYDPALSNGMSRAEVARRLPAILARLNPAGEAIAPAPLAEDPRGWKAAITRALAPNKAMNQRIAAAERALRLARRLGPHDPRTAFSHYIAGRLLLTRDLAEGTRELEKAHTLYSGLYGEDDIHTAEVKLHLATIALARGQASQSLDLARSAIEPARKAGNAALLSSLMMVASEAHRMRGEKAEAARLRLDSLEWARYGIGQDSKIMARLAAFRTLSTKGMAG